MRKKIIFIILSLILGIEIVNAAPTYSLYASANYIESGGKVTATLQLKNVASWNIKIVSNGSTSGCDATFADATANAGNTTKYLSVTCNSTGVGQISFRATGDATSADGQSININVVKVVTVTSPREKDTNNYLKSLGVKDYSITPEFNQETLEYTVEVPSTVNKVTLEASGASNYSSINGTGEVEVNEGPNVFDIKVTSETGAERIYKLTVNVKDENPITIKINNNMYTIMKNVKTIEMPSTYEATTIKINDLDIPAFYSETSTFTLVAVKDTKGTSFLAIYDKDKNTYQLYNENKSNQLLLYLKPIMEEKPNFVKSAITINGQTHECLKLATDDTFILLYAMDILTGKSDFYLYDKEENTYTKYNDTLITSMHQKEAKYKLVIVVAGGVIIVSILINLILLLKKPKQKKAERIKVNKIVKDEPVFEEEKKSVLSKKQLKKEQKKNQKVIESPKTKENPPQSKGQSNEDAMKQVDEATKIIEKFEETVKINKKDLKKAKEEIKDTQEIEATMYDIFSEDKKKKKKKR